MKKEIIKNVIYTSIILLIAVISTYKIYDKFKNDRETDFNSKSLEVVYQNSTKDKIEITKVTPVTDSVGLSSNAYRLSIKNNLTIGVDYTTDYNFYKTAFLNAFPTEAANMVKTIGSTEYVAVIITDPEGANGTQYMASTLDEKGTFVGMVVRSDYTPPTEAEFNTLNEMITTAVLQNEVSPGDDDDYGKSGFKNFVSTYSKNQFTFN